MGWIKSQACLNSSWFLVSVQVVLILLWLCSTSLLVRGEEKWEGDAVEPPLSSRRSRHGLMYWQSWTIGDRGKRKGESRHLSDLDTEEILVQDEFCRTPAEVKQSSGMYTPYLLILSFTLLHLFFHLHCFSYWKQAYQTVGCIAWLCVHLSVHLSVWDTFFWQWSTWCRK